MAFKKGWRRCGWSSVLLFGSWVSSCGTVNGVVDQSSGEKKSQELGRDSRSVNSTCGCYGWVNIIDSSRLACKKCLVALWLFECIFVIYSGGDWMKAHRWFNTVELFMLPVLLLGRNRVGVVLASEGMEDHGANSRCVSWICSGASSIVWDF